MNQNNNSKRFLKCFLASMVIATFICLAYVSGTLAQWSPYTDIQGYNYLAGGPYGGYFKYSDPVRFWGHNIGYFIPPRGIPLPAPGTPMPREITNLLASSNLNTALEGYRLSVPYYLSDISSGWTTWRSPSYYGGYTASGGYNIFTSMPFYSFSGGYFSFPYKSIPASSWSSLSILYPTVSYSNLIRDITDKSPILTIENFIIIRDFVLNNGSRQTYCNMYNNNPYYQFTDEFEVFLNPSSQKYLNCDAPASEFTEIVFRVTSPGPFKYYHVFLGVNDLMLRYDNESESEEDYRKKVEYFFSEALRIIFN